MADLTKRQRELLDLLLEGFHAWPDELSGCLLAQAAPIDPWQRFAMPTIRALVHEGLAEWSEDRETFVATDKARGQACE